MQNEDKAFVNSLLSLSTQLPAAAAPTSASAGETAPLAPGSAVALKLNSLASAERSEACHQKWWKNIDWTSVEADTAEQLSSAELLASVKAEKD